jgi:serine/threonine protein phosphatase PrpC
VQIFTVSDKGPRIENQDSFCFFSTPYGFLGAVADGVGGNKGGGVAARIAIEMLRSSLAVTVPLEETFQHIHLQIVDEANRSPDLKGMATTLTAVSFENYILRGAHCGDSRAYLLRGRGLKQLTIDHTEAARMVADGLMTKAEAVNYPRKNVLASALGTHKELITQSFSSDVKAGDRLLLLTDGVYSEVNKREIQRASAEDSNLEGFCLQLIETVRDRGASDNFTMLAIEFDSFDFPESH